MTEHTNGKGSKPRPLSVDQQTFADNWDRVFNDTLCEYSGLPNTSSYESPPTEYTQLVKSGMFWEVHPGLTGSWQYDKLAWEKIMRDE